MRTNWRKKAQAAIAHLKKGGAIGFRTKNGRELEVREVFDLELGLTFLEILDIKKNQLVHRGMADEDQIKNYINGLFDPLQIAVTRDSEPILVGKVKKTNTLAAAAKNLIDEISTVNCDLEPEFNIFDIVKKDGKVFAVTGIRYDKGEDDFIYECKESIIDTQNPILSLSEKELTKVGSRL